MSLMSRRVLLRLMRLVTEEEEAEAVWDLVRAEEEDPVEEEDDDEEEDISRAVVITIFTLLGNVSKQIDDLSSLLGTLLVCRWHRLIEAAILFINSMVIPSS